LLNKNTALHVYVPSPAHIPSYPSEQVTVLVLCYLQYNYRVTARLVNSISKYSTANTAYKHLFITLKKKTHTRVPYIYLPLLLYIHMYVHWHINLSVITAFKLIQNPFLVT